MRVKASLLMSGQLILRFSSISQNYKVMAFEIEIYASLILGAT